METYTFMTFTIHVANYAYIRHPQQNKVKHVEKLIDDKWHMNNKFILLMFGWMIDTTKHRMLLIDSSTSHDQQDGFWVLNWRKTVCCCGNKRHSKWEFQMIKHSSFIIHSTFWKGWLVSCLAPHMSYISIRIYSFLHFCLAFAGEETFSSVWAKFISNSMSFLIWYIKKYSSSRQSNSMVQQLSIFTAKILISENNWRENANEYRNDLIL